MSRAGGTSLSRPTRAARGGMEATAPAAVASFLLLLTLPAGPSFAEPVGTAELAGQTWGFEVKGGYRDSEATGRIASPFDREKVFLETPDPGDSFELAVVSLYYKGTFQNHLSTKVKVDLIDKWDRNPTSTDREWDVDEAWIRWGPEVEPGDPHEGFTAYAKLGKFPKFERQDDRHLESYGLVSTAFNRMEDVGLEVGVDLGRHFYLKSSLTQGNPVFIRDVNALAGDNGTPELLRSQSPKLGSGLPIFYDADVDELNFDNPEVGLGLGFRLNDDSGRFGLDVLAWGYARDLADTVELHGTFYGGDLDTLNGPVEVSLPRVNPVPIGLAGRDKREYGLNIWLYAGNFSFFGQYVDQEMANLPRTAYEVELAYDWEMPYFELFGQQVFSFLAPAVRFSRLDPDFDTGRHPAVSAKWDWEKVDLGLRLGLINGLDLTLEWGDNEFLRGPATALFKDSEDEYLATFRYNWSRER